MRKEAIPISDINFLIERFEKLLGAAWHIPMSAYLVVNEDELLNILDQLRTAIPKEVKQAERILLERERTIADAEEEAERILQGGRERADLLAADHEVIRRAEAQAQTIIERAHRNAEALRLEADEYARGVLLDLESQLGTLGTQLSNLTGIVQRGLDKLSQPKAPPMDERA